MIFLLQLKDIDVVAGQSLSTCTPAEIVARLRQHYSFLPPSASIAVDNGLVTIIIPDDQGIDQVEAKRLKAKAAQRARQGEYRKAIEIWRRVIELSPTDVVARRDLGMALMEEGEIESAKENLIEAALLDPTDPWSYVVLGNIMMRYEKNSEAAERFYKRSLELKPDDGYALNSMGGLCLEQHRWSEAHDWFDRAIAANRRFANPYYGKSHAFVGQQKPEQALEAIEEMFQVAEKQDERSEPVFRAARESYKETQYALARMRETDIIAALKNYQGLAEAKSGYPILVERRTLDAMIVGQTQMAWKKHRDHHLVRIRSQYPKELLSHIQAHEFTHILMEAEAREFGRNLWFSTTSTSREKALRAMAGDIKKMEQRGFNSEKTAEIVVQLLNGACGLIFNAPLDVVIEERIRRELPLLGHSQYLSLVQMASEAEYISAKKEIRDITPKAILRVNDVLNGVMALWLRDFSRGVADFSQTYRRFDSFAETEKLYVYLQQRLKHRIDPGAEYELV